MAKRRALTPKIRFGIFKRDGFTCRYCGQSPPSVVLEIDHVIAVSDGGTNDNENLVTACFECNRGKGAEPLSVVPDSLAAQLNMRKEAEEQLLAFNRFLKRQRARIDVEISQIAALWYRQFLPPEEKRRWCLTADQRNSLKIFLGKLPVEEILDAVEIAHASVPIKSFTLSPSGLSVNDAKTWKYFCGVCWNKIKRGQPA